MKPIGLTRKPDGELMVVHLCLHCGKVTSNRIAGDDNSYVVVCLLEEPNNRSTEIITRLSRQGIKLLTREDKQEVLTGLYGYDYLRR
jgi:hypothetical protein